MNGFLSVRQCSFPGMYVHVCRSMSVCIHMYTQIVHSYIYECAYMCVYTSMPRHADKSEGGEWERGAKC